MHNVIDFYTKKPVTRAKMQVFLDKIESDYVFIFYDDELNEYNYIHAFKTHTDAMMFIEDALDVWYND